MNLFADRSTSGNVSCMKQPDYAAIAAETGLSKTTVSRVMRGARSHQNDTVAQPTREAVLEAVDALGGDSRTVPEYGSVKRWPTPKRKRKLTSKQTTRKERKTRSDYRERSHMLDVAERLGVDVEQIEQYLEETVGGEYPWIGGNLSKLWSTDADGMQLGLGKTDPVRNKQIRELWSWLLAQAPDGFELKPKRTFQLTCKTCDIEWTATASNIPECPSCSNNKAA